MTPETSQAAILPEYAELLSTVKIEATAAIEAAAIRDRIIRNLSSYRNIELKTRIPFWFVAGIHSLECSLDFTKHLANGDPIDFPTTNEPKGIVGGDWEYGAIAALDLKGYSNKGLDWADMLKCLWRAEKYNGFGYRQYHPECLSPYLWAGTNHYVKGKYVADGTWHGEAVSEQVGIVAIWLALGVVCVPEQVDAVDRSVGGVSSVPRFNGLERSRHPENYKIIVRKSLDKVLTILGMNQRMAPISLIDVAKYYKGLDHQDTALRWLQSQLTDEQLLQFDDKFTPPPIVSGSIATASQSSKSIKLTSDFAVNQYAKLCKYAKLGIANLETKTNYYSQHDNYTQSHRTCNSSTSAMLLDWWLRASGQNGLNGDNEYLRRLLEIGDTIYHENQTKLIEQYGFKSAWFDSDQPTETDFDRIDELLDNGFPVSVNISHRGTDRAPTGGHVILLIARRKSEETYIANDPYGSLSSGYTNLNGRFSLISKASFRARWQGGYRVLI